MTDHAAYVAALNLAMLVRIDRHRYNDSAHILAEGLFAAKERAETAEHSLKVWCDDNTPTWKQRAETAEARIKELENTEAWAYAHNLEARLAVLMGALEKIESEAFSGDQTVFGYIHGLACKARDDSDHAASLLLKRLGAAEAVCRAASDAYNTVMTKANWKPEHFDVLYKDLEAWRREAEGK